MRKILISGQRSSKQGDCMAFTIGEGKKATEQWEAAGNGKLWVPYPGE